MEEAKNLDLNRGKFLLVEGYNYSWSYSSGPINIPCQEIVLVIGDYNSSPSLVNFEDSLLLERLSAHPNPLFEQYLNRFQKFHHEIVCGEYKVSNISKKEAVLLTYIHPTKYRNNKLLNKLEAALLKEEDNERTTRTDEGIEGRGSPDRTGEATESNPGILGSTGRVLDEVDQGSTMVREPNPSL